jgi:hypothetical protein
MYDMCRYEEAWDPHLISVWCAAFEDSDLQVNRLFYFRNFILKEIHSFKCLFPKGFCDGSEIS